MRFAPALAWHIDTTPKNICTYVTVGHDYISTIPRYIACVVGTTLKTSCENSHNYSLVYHCRFACLVIVFESIICE